jgi:leucine efflux protein
MYVLSVAARRGVRAGYAGACGVFIGDAVLMTLSAAGVASLLRAEPTLFAVVKYAGAGYLCWIGFGMLRGAWRRWRGPSPETAAAAPAATPEKPGDERNPFRRALVVSLLNPKAILFFLAFFTQFVDPAYPRPAVTFALLGVIIQAFSVLYLSTLILGGDRLAGAMRRRKRLSASMTGGVGTLFLGFAAKLATATLR